MRLRDRPLKLLLLLIFGTMAIGVAGLDLLDGEVYLRRLGFVSASETPLRFLLLVVGLFLASSIVLLGWLVVRSEWHLNLRRPMKAGFDDPDRRRGLEGRTSSPQKIADH